nr:YoaK family protein [Tissierella sp.]
MERKHRIKSIDNLKAGKLMQVHLVGFILSITAGWINAVGINLFLNESPAFMSGRGLILGYSAFKGDIETFLSVILVIISFTFGAYISAIITRKKGLGFSLVFVASLICLSAFPISLRNRIFDTIMISMAMGSQNAATSLTPINRTTHLTGPATDIGINMAKKKWNIVFFWLLRWISFPLGAVIGFNLVDLFNKEIISLSLTLFLPALIILLIAFLQIKFLHIPLLDEQ